MPPGGIRTHNPSKRAALDPRLRPRSHWDRPGFCYTQRFSTTTMVARTRLIVMLHAHLTVLLCGVEQCNIKLRNLRFVSRVVCEKGRSVAEIVLCRTRRAGGIVLCRTRRAGEIVLCRTRRAGEIVLCRTVEREKLCCVEQ